MRIAQVAPLTEAVPPKLYGGTERVVHWLTEELVALGNEVTLFASGDSKTTAKLEATCVAFASPKWLQESAGPSFNSSPRQVVMLRKFQGMDAPSTGSGSCGGY